MENSTGKQKFGKNDVNNTDILRNLWSNYVPLQHATKTVGAQ